jgi:hypothetical protein
VVVTATRQTPILDCRGFFNLTDDAFSVMILREARDDPSTETRIPLPAGTRVIIDTQRLWHAVWHCSPEPRYCLITSWESGPELGRYARHPQQRVRSAALDPAVADAAYRRRGGAACRAQAGRWALRPPRCSPRPERPPVVSPVKAMGQRCAETARDQANSSGFRAAKHHVDTLGLRIQRPSATGSVGRTNVPTSTCGRNHTFGARRRTNERSSRPRLGCGKSASAADLRAAAFIGMGLSLLGAKPAARHEP